MCNRATHYDSRSRATAIKSSCANARVHHRVHVANAVTWVRLSRAFSHVWKSAFRYNGDRWPADFHRRVENVSRSRLIVSSWLIEIHRRYPAKYNRFPGENELLTFKKFNNLLGTCSSRSCFVDKFAQRRLKIAREEYFIFVFVSYRSERLRENENSGKDLIEQNAKIINGASTCLNSRSVFRRRSWRAELRTTRILANFSWIN